MNKWLSAKCVAVLVSSVLVMLGCGKQASQPTDASGPILPPAEQKKVEGMYQDYMQKMSPDAQGASEAMRGMQGKGAEAKPAEAEPQEGQQKQ